MSTIAGLLGVIICIIFAVFSLNIYKRMFNPMFIMNVLFGPMIFLSIFSLFDFYEVVFDVYAMLSIGILFFNIGCLTLSINESRNIMIGKQDILIEHSRFVDKIIVIFNIILIAIGTVEIINVVPYYMLGLEAADIRGIYFQGSNTLVYGTAELWQVIRTYITSPLTLVVVSVSSIWLVVEKRICQFVVSLLIVFIQIIVSFSRFSILYVIIALSISLAVSRFMFTGYASVSGKVKRNVRLLFIACALGIFGVSVARGVENFFVSFYEYYCGCIFLLNQLLPNIPEGATMGLVSFQGIIAPIYFALHQMFGVSYASEYINAISVLSVKDAPYIISANGHVTNAFGTMLYALLCDFGFIGIPFGMLLFGFFSGVIYRKMLRFPSERNIAVYIITVIAIVKSIQDYAFSTSTLIIPIVIICLIYRKNQNNVRD